MKRSFWSYISNGKYSIGTTGGMVYVYDEADREVAQLKVTNYSYELSFFPDGSRFAVRSNEGVISVYDLYDFHLIKKFRYGKAKDPQDGNMCVSLDSKYLYIVNYTFDKKKEAPNLWIDVYETESFTLVKTLLKEEDIYPKYIEWAEDEQSFYILGAAYKDEVCWLGGKYIIAKYDGEKLLTKVIYEKTRELYFNLKTWQISGFTARQREWIYPKDQVLEKLDKPLAKLWKMKSKK